MARSLFLILLILCVPAFAKPHNEKQPVSCSDLWAAVTDTLGNSGNYKVVAKDHDEMKANFYVVGAMVSQMNLVELKSRNSGCEMKLRMGFSGADDEGAFRNRVGRALKKLNAEKSSAQPDSSAAQ